MFKVQWVVSYCMSLTCVNLDVIANLMVTMFTVNLVKVICAWFSQKWCFWIGPWFTWSSRSGIFTGLTATSTLILIIWVNNYMSYCCPNGILDSIIYYNNGIVNFPLHDLFDKLGIYTPRASTDAYHSLFKITVFYADSVWSNSFLWSISYPIVQVDEWKPICVEMLKFIQVL